MLRSESLQLFNYFITPRKFKNTSRNSKFRKDKKISYCDFYRFKYVKIFKHAILHLRLFQAD